jgi:hypothetical protein
MKLFFGGVIVGLVTFAQAQTAYVDVPSCHWAVQAINVVSSGDKVTPAQSSANAQNAVRQVFEGIQCGDPAWVKNFIANAPSGLDAQVIQKPMRSFSITFGRTTIDGNGATVAINLTLSLSTGVVRRTATVSLSSDVKTAWKVNYASLAALNLSMFPK